MEFSKKEAYVSIQENKTYLSRKDVYYTSVERGWDLAEWLERLAVNAEVATVLGFDPSILWHSGIWGAADEAVLNNVHKNNKNPPVESTSSRRAGGAVYCLANLSTIQSRQNE